MIAIRSVELPETVVLDLEAAVSACRMSSIREFLQQRREESQRRRRAFQEAIANMARLRQQIFEQHGLHPDSTLLIREDRDR